MTRIDHTAQIATLIRAQIGAQTRTRSDPAAKAKSTQAASSAQVTDRSLHALVALRVSALSPDDPQRRRKAFRIFLESTLLQELGRDRINDPGFDELVDKVLMQMETDVALDAALLEAGEHLLADHDGSPDPKGGAASPVSARPANPDTP